MSVPRGPSSGFTLLEILLAIAILSLIGTLIFSSFLHISSASEQADEAMTSLHHGEIILEQLVTSLRSAAYFDLNAEKYGFWHEDDGGSEPEDMLSWVSGTMAFIPPRYPTQQGLHRLYVSMDKIDGVRGLAVAAYPHLVDPEDDEVEEIEPWLVSSRVVGFNVRFYNVSEEDWEDEWEKDKQLPQFLEVTLLMQPGEEDDDPVKLVRQIHIPLGKISRDTRRGKRKVDDSARSNAPPSEDAGASITAPGITPPGTRSPR